MGFFSPYNNFLDVENSSIFFIEQKQNHSKKTFYRPVERFNTKTYAELVC